MSVTAPSAYKLQSIVSQALQTLERLREEDGQIIETDAELLDALASEGVDFETLMRRLVASTLDDKALAAAAEARINDIRTRHERFLRNGGVKRQIIAAILEQIGMRKYTCAEATVTLSDGKAKVTVTDPDTLPDTLVEIRTVRTPDKALIKAALERGEALIGVTLGNSAPVLSIRPR